MNRVFANGLRDGVQSQVESTKDPKMVLDATFLNTQHPKVRSKVKVELFKKCPLKHLGISKVDLSRG